jgi:hypothetical protein
MDRDSIEGKLDFLFDEAPKQKPQTRRYDLHELVSRIDATNLHSETDWLDS